MTFEIEQGIPVEELPRGRKVVYPFNELDIGESFFIPVTESIPKPWDRYAANVHWANRRYAPKQFIKRKAIHPEMGEGVRIWRIDPEQDLDNIPVITDHVVPPVLASSVTPETFGNGNPNKKLRDSFGVPWSPLIHSNQQTKKLDGSWRIANGLTDEMKRVALKYVEEWRKKANPPPKTCSKKKLDLEFQRVMQEYGEGALKEVLKKVYRTVGVSDDDEELDALDTDASLRAGVYNELARLFPVKKAA